MPAINRLIGRLLLERRLLELLGGVVKGLETRCSGWKANNEARARKLPLAATLRAD
jgi:hypothetical protein